jgi:RNA polymerase sigma-70 factor (ECF subfamily)
MGKNVRTIKKRRSGADQHMGRLWATMSASMPEKPPNRLDPTTVASTTVRLLARARAGDGHALNQLFERFGPELRRLARGRLPRHARGAVDTPDLVQDTLVQTFTHIDRFEDRGDGALRAYMRQVLLNRIRDECRRAARRLPHESLHADAEAGGPSPLEAAVGAQVVARYDAALARLPEGDRELVIARFELGLSYPEIAVATGRSTPNAARMALVRALVKLSEALGHEREPDRTE